MSKILESKFITGVAIGQIPLHTDSNHASRIMGGMCYIIMDVLWMWITRLESRLFLPLLRFLLPSRLSASSLFFSLP